MSKEKAVCNTCGKEFYFYRSTRSGKFCSRGCIKVSPNNGQFKNQNKVQTSKCLNCDKEFEFYSSTRRTGKFCSYKCSWQSGGCIKNLPKNMSGENNPAWKGGITPTTRKERKRFVYEVGKLVLKRDNYTCQMCHRIGGKLQVDHIQKWSEYVEQRFNINNCRTLCVGCHYKVTFGRVMPKDSKWGFYNRLEAVQ